jgi:hypothetical protein
LADGAVGVGAADDDTEELLLEETVPELDGILVELELDPIVLVLGPVVLETEPLELETELPELELDAVELPEDDETVVLVTEDDKLVGALPLTYRFNRLPAPQYSVALSLQGMLQSLFATLRELALRVAPHQHSPPYSIPAYMMLLL